MASKQRVATNLSEDRPMAKFEPKFNVTDLIGQYKELKAPEAKVAKKAGQKAETISARRSISGAYPTIVALHEHLLVEGYNAEMEPYQVQAMIAKAMDMEFPACANTTGKSKKLKVVRADADGKPMMINGEPVTRQYDSKHFAWYRNNILGKGIFKYAEEMGLDDDDIKNAIDAYHASREDDDDDDGEGDAE